MDAIIIAVLPLTLMNLGSNLLAEVAWKRDTAPGFKRRSDPAVVPSGLAAQSLVLTLTLTLTLTLNLTLTEPPKPIPADDFTCVL